MSGEMQRWFYNHEGVCLGSYAGPDDTLPAWFVGASIGPAPTAPTVSEYQSAIQAMIDDTARSKQFNDGVTMASYAASTVGPWAAQAQAFIAWRDNVWQYAYSELSKVKAGKRAQPTVEDFLLELPEIVWPAS